MENSNGTNRANGTEFGVGCFHFGIRKIPSSGMTGSGYIQKLGEALENLPNTNNIKIDGDEEFCNYELIAESHITSLSDGEDFYPFPQSGLSISFDLYIPKRLQSDVFPRPGWKMTSERFRVYIRYPFYFPVAYVELVDTNEQDYPSDGVVLVREFLERHFDVSNDEAIFFESLGPSPFHADFFLSEGDPDNGNSYIKGYVCDIIQEKGYDQITFQYDNNLFETLEEAKDELFNVLENELGFFLSLKTYIFT